ncbi:hypothetical protein BGZ83_006470 [Gryganskiella cystojenkinii]|nr:hypothetical protein BGZ83_006470 [Gryganskiella cystojenkinii]
MESRIFVEHLSWNTTDESLRSAFSSYGNIVDLIVAKEASSGRSRGFGYVTFADAGGAQNAIQAMNNTDLEGRQIKVRRATPQDGDVIGSGYSSGGLRDQGTRDSARADAGYMDDSSQYQGGGYSNGGLRDQGTHDYARADAGYMDDSSQYQGGYEEPASRTSW